jgi:pyruvate,water dikinase
MAGKERHLWVTHNLAETLPAPMPLTWDIISGFMSGDGGFGLMYQDFGYRPSARVRQQGFLELICGRIYADPDRAAELFWEGMPLEYDLEALVKDKTLLEAPPARFNADKADPAFLLRLPGTVWALLRSSRRLKRLRREIRDQFETSVLPPYLDYVREKHAQDLTRLATPEVIAELNARRSRVLDGFGKESLKPGFFGGMALEALKGKLTQLLGQDEGTALTLALTAGLPGDTTVEQDLCLFAVAQGQTPLAEFLERYGHRTVGEMELAQPRWREDPSYIEKTLTTYRKHPGRSPEETHAANERKREDAEKALPELLAQWGGSCLREDIERDLRDAQSLLPYRESAKHYLMMGYEVIRLAILELERRWGLNRDVFFLRLGELDRFEAERAELTGEIQQRKTRWQSARQLQLPDVVDSTQLDHLGHSLALQAAAELHGDPVAPGVAMGTARIVFDPTEARDLGADFVLVCPSTDPGWTPLFANARGLVIERGGVLSHGAIVARDFGIPAVVCPGATQQIQDGATVQIDGNHGVIHVVKET